MVLKNMLNMQMMMFLLVLIGFLIRKQNIVDLLTMFLDIDPLLRGIAVIMQECRLRSQRRCFQRNTTGTRHMLRE